MVFQRKIKVDQEVEKEIDKIVFVLFVVIQIIDSF